MYIQRTLTPEYLNSLLERHCKISTFACFSAPSNWNLLVNDEINLLQIDQQSSVFHLSKKKKVERFHFYYFILCYAENRKILAGGARAGGLHSVQSNWVFLNSFLLRYYIM